MVERDFPEGHPSAPDYRGEKYTPPRAPYSDDFPPGHPARGGANVTDADTPDGMRMHVEIEHEANAERTKNMQLPTAAE